MRSQAAKRRFVFWRLFVAVANYKAANFFAHEGVWKVERFENSTAIDVV